MRGFALNELSPPLPEDELPTDHDSETSGGGEHKLVGSIELERDFPRNFRGAVFFDIGNAFNDWSTPLEYSVGIGVRWKLPMLMIGFDVAQALSEDRPEAALPPQHDPGALGAPRLVIAGRACAAGVLVGVAGASVAVHAAGPRVRRWRSSSGCRRMRIEVIGARGTLAGPLAADRIVVDHEAARIECARSERRLAGLRALLIGLVTLDDLAIGKVEVRLKERPERPETEPHFLPAWLRIAAPAFRVADVAVTLQGGQTLVATAGPRLAAAHPLAARARAACRARTAGPRRRQAGAACHRAARA